MLPPVVDRLTSPPDIVSDEIVAVVALTLNTRSDDGPEACVVARAPAPTIVTGAIDLERGRLESW